MSKSKTITKRSDDYSAWYLDLIEAGDLAEHGPAKGTMIIKPYGYAIWENIQRIMNDAIVATGVKNAYFPLFIPQSFLSKEKEHVEGFSPELAVVTHGGGEKLEEPLVVRPTSETIMYDAYARWIQSYRDLPLLINQWCNVVRWEKRPRLFLRTTEFLWQEGHTAHATASEALDRTMQMLAVYADFARDYLALPVVQGQKSESEKFAGAVSTFTIEAMMQDGKALQLGTSHFLGQNFSKVFNIRFLTKESTEDFAWQTSWGVTTRLIGGLIMVHSDDSGLVLPPKIAPFPVVIVTMLEPETADEVLKKADNIAAQIASAHIKVEVDKRDNMRLGAKIFEWEKKGVPIRIEVGPKDLKDNKVVIARRDTGEKVTVTDGEVMAVVEKLLIEIQANLLSKAQQFLKNKTYQVDTWEDFKEKIENPGGFIYAHWCGNEKCETDIKEQVKATTRCFPLEGKLEKGKCIKCGKDADRRIIFAKSY